MEFYRKLKKSRMPWYLFYGGLTIELLIVIVDKSNLINPFEGRSARRYPPRTAVCPPLPSNIWLCYIPDGPPPAP